jgi:hypothetical protein
MARFRGALLWLARALRDYPGDVEEVNVVDVGHGGRLPARVRALIDFLVDEVDLDDASDLFE